ncbi:MAG: diguanylate cyclase, partial [Saezia sp.]
TMDHLNEGVLLFDKVGIYLDANRSAKAIFPQLQNTSLGTNIMDMHYLPFQLEILGNQRSDSHIGDFTKQINGEITTFSISVSQVNRRNKTIGYSTIINNITPIKTLLKQMEEKSAKDPLTGIYNRGFLFEIGASLLEEAAITGEPICAIMMDIDYFKKINDTYGHPYGDYVLQTIAALCKSTFRKTDIVARYGGEEFCVLLPKTPLAPAKRKAESLRETIAKYPFSHDGIEATLTISMGLACNDGFLDDSFEGVIKEADQNLYLSKQNGRNQVT